MNAANWIAGPQAVGLIIFIIGLIQYSLPPKRINNWYGYRSQLAQRNQQTWDEANRYAALYMIKCGLIVVITGLFLTITLHEVPMPGKLQKALTVLLLITGGIAPALFLIIATEKHLTKTFDQHPE